MIHIDWPWMLACLPLPLLVRWLLPPAPAGGEAALRVPVLGDFEQAAAAGAGGRRRRWRLWLAVLAWALLVAAATRPQWLGEPLDVPVTGRDLMLAVDLSGSMEQTDFEIGGRVVDRLTATKMVAGDFIERRVGDRIGLILFGRQAYLQAPLTFDRATVQKLLDEAVIGLAGKETAIGDAIGLAVKRLRRDPSEEQVLLLLTDGANTAGVIEPMKAAELAAAEGLTIHTIGIGADEMTVRSLFGSHRVNPSLDLDEVTLRGIADMTGGRYFRARDTAELEAIYGLIDQIEPVAKDPIQYRPRRELFPWPLALALAAAVALALPRRGRA